MCLTLLLPNERHNLYPYFSINTNYVPDSTRYYSRLHFAYSKQIRPVIAESCYLEHMANEVDAQRVPPPRMHNRID